MRIDSNAHHFVDEQNRTRIFHGLNVVFKQPPFVPQADAWDADFSFSEEDARDLRRWGFNVIRLGVLWAGTFPAHPHVPDPGYMQAVMKIIRICRAEGIHVIVDMHSDVLSRRFCGNGIPDWAVDIALDALGQHSSVGDFPTPQYKQSEFFDDAVLGAGSQAERLAEAVGARTATEVAKANAELYPKLHACLAHDFWGYYSSNATGGVVHALYSNMANLSDHFEEHWRAVAGHLKNDSAVLMYDIFNEPWPGASSGLALPLPAQWWLDADYSERGFYAAFHRRAQTAIREVDERHVVAMEPVDVNFWDRSLGRPDVKPGYEDRDALSWHSYCAFRPDWWLPRLICLTHHASMFASKAQHLRQFGGAAVLSEFGSLSSDPVNLQEIRRVSDYADDALMSTVYWQYKSYKDITSSGGYGGLSLYTDGELQEEKLRVLSRPYAQAIAGEPRIMFFDAETGVFVLEYTAKGAGSTEVHISRDLHYPDGFRVLSTAGIAVSQSEDSLLSVTHSDAAEGQAIAICIIPCPHESCSTDLSWYHPCGLRNRDFKWQHLLLFSSAALVYIAVWSSQGKPSSLRPDSGRYKVAPRSADAETQDTVSTADTETPRSSGARLLSDETHPPHPGTASTHQTESLSGAATLELLAFLVSAAALVSSAVLLHLPWHDELWRWLCWSLGIAALLHSTTIASGLRMPSLVAGFGGLPVLHRMSHLISDPFCNVGILLALLRPLLVVSLWLVYLQLAWKLSSQRRTSLGSEHARFSGGGDQQFKLCGAYCAEAGEGGGV